MFGVISPRYLTALLGSSFVALFCVGVSVLAFDMQSRDENNGINEVLATKPVGNAQYFLGRLLGIFLCMGIPFATIVLLTVLFGFITEVFAFPFGGQIELWSIASLLLLDVFPNFVFFGFLVLFLASFIRPRFVALLLTVFCLFAVLWINSRLPLSISEPLQTVTGEVIFPSELTPTFLNAEVLFNRITLVMMGIGFLYCLSLVYTRNTSSGMKQRRAGMCAFGTGMFLIAGMYGSYFLEQHQISGWKRVHDAHYQVATFPDVHNIEGTVEIHPGRSVSLDLNILVSSSDKHDGEDVPFSFNPGYRINYLSIDGEKITDYEFRNGLLKIPRHYFDAEDVTLNLKAKGRPNSQFAYLDSVERISKIFGPEVRQLRYLGTENYVFHPNFVVLMPGIKWYPVAGTATNEENWNERLKDFFTIDLQVSVPRKWIVAGPAKRKLVSDEKRSTFQFHTVNPIPQLALIASRFERASQTIEGIEFEVLYSKVHRRTFESLNPLGNLVASSIQEHLNNIESTRLIYPYSVFSLVEVPASLRMFGGGSNFDTVLGMPGVLMMPETTLPTLHIDSLRDPIDFERRDTFTWDFDRWMAKLVLPLQQYLGNELYAGNHLSHFYRSIVSDQISATGSSADWLNLIFEQVVQLNFADYDISFDFDLALDREILDLTYLNPFQIASVGNRVADRYRTERMFSLTESREHKLTSDDTIRAAELIAAAKYDSHRDFDNVNHRAFRLRGKAISRVLIDTLSPAVINSIIAELIRHHRGQNFSYEDFLTVVRAHGVSIEKGVNDMLNSRNLPGFLTSNLTERRIGTAEEGLSRYQVTFLLENAEPVSGYCVLKPINDIDFVHDTDPRFTSSKVVFIEKNQVLEIVIESTPPIIDIVIEPYLSLNRTQLRLNVNSLHDVRNDPSYDRRRTWGGGEVVSVREVETISTNEENFLVIDDLDQGFSIVESPSVWKFNPITLFANRLAGKPEPPQIRGLPAFQFERNLVSRDTWERKADTTAYGKYWRTFALNRDGQGGTFAKFSSSLPSAGRWRLDYYVPEGNFSRIRSFQGHSTITRMNFQKGIANIDVHINSDVISHSIDMSAVTHGWHTIGEYEIENPDIEVKVSNKTKWGVVFADAIRWYSMGTQN